MTLEEAEKRIQGLEQELASTKECLSELVALIFAELEDDGGMDPLEAAHQKMMEGVRAERESMRSEMEDYT